MKKPRMMAVLDPIKLVITNYPENEIEYLSLRYDEDILKNLTTKSLTSMDFGSDIFIFINKKSDNEEILEVKIEFYLENDIDKLEKSFLKYKWMEYYE